MARVISKTRWELNDNRGYGEKFAQMIADGQDVSGEARLADAIAPRGANILDAGCGMGRIGGTLLDSGHTVIGVDLDAKLLKQAKETYPNLPTVQGRLDKLDAKMLKKANFSGSFDLIVCVGNVMILLAEDTEQEVLKRFNSLLAPGGRVLVGFHTNATPPGSREYSAEEFTIDAIHAGLRVDSRMSSYHLHPHDLAGDYVVHVLSSATN